METKAEFSCQRIHSDGTKAPVLVQEVAITKNDVEGGNRGEDDGDAEFDQSLCNLLVKSPAHFPQRQRREYAAQKYLCDDCADDHSQSAQLKDDHEKYIQSDLHNEFGQT